MSGEPGRVDSFLVLLDVAVVIRIPHARLAPDQRPVGRARVARDVVLGVVEGLQGLRLVGRSSNSRFADESKKSTRL